MTGPESSEDERTPHARAITPGEENGRVSPQEAFSILGNATRMSIMQELWKATEPRVAFAELQNRVGHQDRGNFRYHLNELVGHFVDRTEDGYALELAGEAVVRAVVKGSITQNLTIDPVRLDDRCPFCGAPVELAYEDRLNVCCSSCPGVIGGEYPPGTYMHYRFPPAGLQDRTPEDVLSAAHAFYDSKITPMFDGVCPECAGRTEVTIDICPDHDSNGEQLCGTCNTSSEVWAQLACTRCGYARRSLVWFSIMNHPAVVSFYEEHGDISEQVPFRKLVYENAEYLRGIDQTVASSDPLRIRISIDYEGERLDVTVDGELAVVDIERS